MASESKHNDDDTKAPVSQVSVAAKPIEGVIVHPLVLLSVTDHYNRVAKDTRRRVVGVLLGESYKGRVDVTNSFAVPFEEDPSDPTIFFLDHDYLESMFNMHKKVSAKERIVGFYSTGPRIRPADLHIDALFRHRKYVATPLLVIVDVRPDVQGLPVQSYASHDTLSEAKEATRTFAHITCEVGAYEAEEVGVEHLLRDINDPSLSSLGGELRGKLGGLEGLGSRLGEVAAYCEAVLEGKLPRNNEILYAIQTLLAKLPDTNVPEMGAALRETTNDEHLALYVGSLSRAVLALHDLTLNKISVRDAEEGEGNGKKEEKEAAAAGKGEKADKSVEKGKKK